MNAVRVHEASPNKIDAGLRLRGFKAQWRAWGTRHIQVDKARQPI